MGPTPAKVGRIRLERNWVAPTQTPVLIPDPLGNHRENCAGGSGISHYLLDHWTWIQA
jgi:hypothetical protein